MKRTNETTYLGDCAALGSTANSRTLLLVFFVAFFVAFFNMDVFGFEEILEDNEERPPNERLSIESLKIASSSSSSEEMSTVTNTGENQKNNKTCENCDQMKFELSYSKPQQWKAWPQQKGGGRFHLLSSNDAKTSRLLCVFAVFFG